MTRSFRPLEKVVLKQCRQYLELRGFMVLRLNSGAVTGEYKGKRRYVRFNDAPGCSDLLAIKASTKGAVTLFVECKRPGGKVTPAQESFLDAARRHGAVGVVADGLDSLIRQLEEHGV